MLLNCLALSVLIVIAAATIHENRRQVFQSPALGLPVELKALIADFYLPVYGDSPPSPILSQDMVLLYYRRYKTCEFCFKSFAIATQSNEASASPQPQG